MNVGSIAISLGFVFCGVYQQSCIDILFVLCVRCGHESTTLIVIVYIHHIAAKCGKGDPWRKRLLILQ